MSYDRLTLSDETNGIIWREYPTVAELDQVRRTYFSGKARDTVILSPNPNEFSNGQVRGVLSMFCVDDRSRVRGRPDSSRLSDMQAVEKHCLRHFSKRVPDNATVYVARDGAVKVKESAQVSIP